MSPATAPSVLERLRGGLVVSCQAYPGEPMNDPQTMAQVAAAVTQGGAVGVRVQGPDDVALTRAAVDVPVIGLWKVGHEGVFITPTLEHALTVVARGADVVAVDGTRRPRPDGLTLTEVTRELHARTPALVMADCGSTEDALAAQEAGVDLLGTTLAGYTGERPRGDGPDLELLADVLSRTEGLPVLCEGRVGSPAQARAALDAGAHAVVVGTAITHPTTITARFVEALPARPTREAAPWRS